MLDNRFSGRDKWREVRVGTLGININVYPMHMLGCYGVI